MDPSAAAPPPHPPGSRLRLAGGGRRPSGPEAPRPAATTRRSITFASGPGEWWEPPRAAPSRSPSREGEFLPVDVLFRNAKDQ